MSTIELTTDTLHIHLSLAEKIGALHGDLHVPRSAIQAVAVIEDGLSAARGIRAPGVAIPGRLKIGTWRSYDQSCFVLIRRGQPTLHLTLHGQTIDAVLISTPEAGDLAAQFTRPATQPTPDL
jgi:hypothetical protein